MKIIKNKKQIEAFINNIAEKGIWTNKDRKQINKIGMTRSQQQEIFSKGMDKRYGKRPKIVEEYEKVIIYY